jgi:hypothetical protein
VPVEFLTAILAQAPIPCAVYHYTPLSEADFHTSTILLKNRILSLPEAAYLHPNGKWIWAILTDQGSGFRGNTFDRPYQRQATLMGVGVTQKN